jgi:nicotinamidase-related amidase
MLVGRARRGLLRSLHGLGLPDEMRLRLGSSSGTVFLLCDLQEGFAPRLDMESVAGVAQTLARTAWTLGFPVVATEQNPTRLGRTVSALKPWLAYEDAESVMPSTPVNLRPDGKAGAELEATVPSRAFIPVFEKMNFSMVSGPLLQYADDALRARAAHFKTQSAQDGAGLFARAVLCGIETHVCVLNTALDLLDQGIEVHVVVDGVASQRTGDRSVALRRLEAAGAVLTTTESCMLELIEGANHPAFKSISKLLKEHNELRLSKLDHF